MDKPILVKKKSNFADYQTRYAAYIVIEKDQQDCSNRGSKWCFFFLAGN